MLVFAKADKAEAAKAAGADYVGEMDMVEKIHASTLAAFRSGILVSAILRTSSLLMVATLVLLGTPEPDSGAVSNGTESYWIRQITDSRR
mgnify:CR=1 FL=1